VTTSVHMRSALLSAMMMIAGVGHLAGCHGHRAAPSAPATTPGGAFAGDTVRGIVSIVGSEPLTTVQLTSADGRGWQLVGDSLSALRAASGLEVMVHGVVLTPDGESRPSTRLQAVRFTVRGADGVAALDGVLERVGTGFALRLDDGRRAPLAAVPTTLREQIGSRIWWAGPSDRAPIAYGVLTTRR
jgi:hypothetical protein